MTGKWVVLLGMSAVACAPSITLREPVRKPGVAPGQELKAMCAARGPADYVGVRNDPRGAVVMFYTDGDNRKELQNRVRNALKKQTAAQAQGPNTLVVSDMPNGVKLQVTTESPDRVAGLQQEVRREVEQFAAGKCP